MSTTPVPGIDPGVFWPAIVIAVGFELCGVVSPGTSDAVATVVLNRIIKTFGWSFVVSTAFFLIFAVFLALSRFGKIRLGHDDEKPEFSTVSWVCMMFSVGMGIGLMFWASPNQCSISARRHTAWPTTIEGSGAGRHAIRLFPLALHPGCFSVAIVAVFERRRAYSLPSLC